MTEAAILLIGAGGHAAACIDVIEAEGRYRVAGLVGLEEEVGSEVVGYPVLGTDADLPRLLGDVAATLIAVGQIKTAEPRARLYDRVKALGGSFATIISPRAHLSAHASVGEGTIVMHGAVVNARAKVGRNTILNSLSLVEHDCHIGDHCHVSTNVAVNSGVRVGHGTFIGSGSSVRQAVTIGSGCVIGMGQRVLKDCPDGSWLPRTARREG